jgi:YfiH family protein
MLTKNAYGMYQTPLFANIPNLVHGFSSRQLGDGRTQKVKAAICSALSCDVETLTQSKQIHSARVQLVDAPSRTPVSDADGLVTASFGMMLGVRTADCVPILLVDPKTKITSAVHAGWKGTRGEIVKHAIEEMIAKGAKPANILAIIGPHIGMCCYNVSADRAEYFLKKYPNDAKVISQHNGVWYLDIGWINFRQLIEAGVLPEHIDAHPMCTSCQIDEFFSYRKDTKESFGEMLGVIGWKKHI